MYRSLPLNIILTIVTCGIYGLYWFVVLTNDVNQLSGRRNDTSGGMALFLSIITCGIYSIYWAYKLGEKMSIIKTLYYGRDSSDSILYLILQIIGLPIITYALAQNEINTIIEGRGGYYPGDANMNYGPNGYANQNMNGQNGFNGNNGAYQSNIYNQPNNPNGNMYSQGGNQQNMYGQNMNQQNQTDQFRNNQDNGEVEDYGDE